MDATSLFIETLKSPYLAANPLRTQTQKAQYGSLISQIIDQLLNEAGDNNAKLKQLALEALSLAAKHPSLGGVAIIERILARKEEGSQNGADKASIMNNSTKHQSARLQVLGSVIKETNLRDSVTDVNRILKYGVDYLQSNNASVRMGAYLVLANVYAQIGPTMFSMINGARPIQMEILNTACRMVD